MYLLYIIIHSLYNINVIIGYSNVRNKNSLLVFGKFIIRLIRKK